MTDGTGFDAFEQEFADFNHRVTALRAAREDSPDVLDAVFLELELAQEELRVMHEEVTEQSQEVSRHSDAVDRERTLLRAVFGELPVPVFVLDDGGFIRRANGAAAELLGTSTAYMAGKPFPVFVDLAARAAFRSQLSAVLRGAGPVAFSSVVLAARRRLRSRLMLARVSLPSEVRPLVTVAVVPPAAQPAAPPGVSRRGLAPAAAEPATRRPPGSAPEEDALAAATRRVDLLSQVTRLLLDEQSLSEPVTLHRVAWLLQADAAEWVIIDLVRGAGITRAVVAGPDLPPRPLVAGERAEPAPLHTQVLASGRAVLQPVIEDENALGLATTGSPVLTALGAGSVLCVPMRANGTTAGVLTMVRPPEQRPFSLSDLRIFEEIGEHLALALHNGRRYQRRSDTATALRASVLPRGPVQIPGLDWAAAYRVGTEGAEVGGDFYDLFRSPGGWGVVLGDVCGKGEEAAAVTAMVRHGIRLLSLWDAAPAQVLAKVNTAMLAQQETDRFVTAVAAHLSWQERGPRRRAGQRRAPGGGGGPGRRHRLFLIRGRPAARPVRGRGRPGPNGCCCSPGTRSCSTPTG